MVVWSVVESVGLLRGFVTVNEEEVAVAASKGRVDVEGPGHGERG